MLVPVGKLVIAILVKPNQECSPNCWVDIFKIGDELPEDGIFNTDNLYFNTDNTQLNKMLRNVKGDAAVIESASLSVLEALLLYKSDPDTSRWMTMCKLREIANGFRRPSVI